MNSANRSRPQPSAPKTAAHRLHALILAFAVAALIAPVSGVGANDELEVTGDVVVEHADDFERGRSEQYTMLETNRGRFRLEGKRARGLHGGEKVRARGKRQGETLVLGADSSLTVLAAPGDGGTSTDVPSTSTSTSTATMPKRVAVLLVNFVSPSSPTPTPTPSASPSGSPSTSPSPTPSPTPAPTGLEPWTHATVRGLYFTNQKSVASYFTEVSDGQMSITGDVFGYFTIATSTSSCDYTAWGTAARQAATAANINLSAYTNVVHAWPKQASCWWGGMGQLPGKYSWINGSMSLYVTSHELGHNFGAHHASTIACTQSGKAVSLSGSCTLDEYGDPFDVMGSSAQRHLQGFHRRQLGFFGADKQLTVTKSGDYTVATAQVATGTPRVLRVQRNASEFFYVEFRQPFGLYDNFATTAAAVNGVMVRIGPDTKRTQTKLIDMNPQTTTFSDAPLAAGRTFADGSLSITTLSVSTTGATVRVQFGPDTTPPTTPANLTSSNVSGGVRLDWAPSTDDVEVTGYRVARDGVVMGTVSATSWTDTSPTSGATHSYAVRAFDAAGNLSGAATRAHTAPDVTPPGAPRSVTVVQTAGRAVSISWEAATDNVGVTGYRVLRNGSQWQTTTATSLSDSTVMDGFTYQYIVHAVDAAGNVGPGTAGSVSLPDVTPPSAPGAMSLTAASTTSTQLTWGAATDNVAVTGYRVSRDGALVATLPASARSYSQTGLTTDRTYTYTVTAFDAAGNVGPALSSQVRLVGADTVAPSVPRNLTAKAQSKRYVSLSWTASTDDRPGTIRYRIFRNDRLLTTVTTTTYVDRPAAVGWYTYKVRAIDVAGNKSAFTPKVRVKAVRAV